MVWKWWSRRFLLLKYVCVGASIAWVGTAQAAVLFEGSVPGDFSLSGSGTVSEASDPLGGGATVIEMRAEEGEGPPRAEADTPPVVQPGQEFWLHTRFLIPAGFPAVEGGAVRLLALTGRPFGGAPAFELTIADERLRWERNETYGGDAPWEAPLERGRWTDLLVHERYDEAGRGFVEMWVDGERVTFFKEGFSSNPGERLETPRLAMATQDGSDSEGPLEARLMNARPEGLFASGTVYFDGLEIGEERADVTDLRFDGASLEDFASVVSAPGAVSEVSDPLGSGENVFKMEVDESETPFGHPRAEADSPAIIHPGEEFWLRTKFLVPEGFPAVEGGSVTLLALTGRPFEGSPAWEISLADEKLRWERNSTYGGDAPWEMPLERGRWTTVLLHERYDVENQGFVEMWIDGERVTFFEPGSSTNPSEHPPTRHLTMATRDVSNEEGPLEARLVSSRPEGLFASGTVYFGALKIGEARSEVISPSFDGWVPADFGAVVAGEGAVSEAADPLGSGQAVTKLEVEEGVETPFGSPRAEVDSPPVILPGEEFWLRTKVLIPEGFPAVEGGSVALLSLAGRPFAGAPAWEISVAGEHLRWERNETYGGDAPWEMPIERGRWTRILLHERYDVAGKGFVEMWVDGEPVTFFAPGSSYNPGSHPETTRLTMATRDATDEEGPLEARLINSRPEGLFASGTVYFGPLSVGEAASDVAETWFEGLKRDVFVNETVHPEEEEAEVLDPAGSGERAIKMTVSEMDSREGETVSVRAQLKAPPVIRPGEEFWWHSRFYLPTSFPEEGPQYLLLMEGPFGPPESGSPPFSIGVSGRHIEWERDQTYNDVPWQISLKRGQWVDVLAHVKFAAEGWVELWIDGEKVTFFKAGASVNPHEEAATQQLKMATLDEFNGTGPDRLYIQSYRPLGGFPSLTVYQGGMKYGPDRTDVEW